MSYEKCNYIKIKGNRIKLRLASNNVRPLYYETVEICGKYDLDIDQKLKLLFFDMLAGNIQISSINKDTVDFAYAIEQIRPILNVMEKSEKVDWYDRVHNTYGKLIDERTKELGIERLDFYRDYKQEDKELFVKAITQEIGKYFKAWKDFIFQKDDNKYILKYCNGYVKKPLYRNQYFTRFYGCSYNDAERMDYKKAFLVKNGFSSYKMEIIKD